MKYNFNLLLKKGDLTAFKLPKNDKVVKGRPLEETRTRVSAYAYAKSKGFKVSCIKKTNLLTVKRIS